MKKYSSVWMLYARSTIYPLMALLGIMAAADVLLFGLAAGPSMSLTMIFRDSHIPQAALVVYLLWSAVLLVPSSAKAGCTLNRLRIGPRAVFACHAGYNTLCYVILWGFQAMILLAVFGWHGTQADPNVYGPQSILLAFYGEQFLHSLLPMRDWTGILRMLVLSGGLGVISASVPVRLRRGKSIIAPLAVIAVGLPAVFRMKLAEPGEDLIVMVGAVVLAIVAIRSAFPGSEEESYL